MSNKLKGTLLAGFGGSMWGVSGIFAQLLFSRYAVSSEWLVSTRLLTAGCLLLVYSRFIRKDNIFAAWCRWGDFLQLLLFSLVGMTGVQYFFFKAIEVSSASLATILQFTGPIFVYFYMLFSKEKHLNLRELILVMLTFFGVLLIVTNGNFTKLAVSPIGFIMGTSSAVAVAFYSLQPRTLLAKYGSPVVVGWGMVLAGAAFQIIHPFWQPGFTLTRESLFLLIGIILFGTAMAFLAYLSSLNYIEASLASIMTALEPLLAAILSVVIFGRVFGIYEILGISIVLLAVLVLSTIDQKQQAEMGAYKKDAENT